MPATAASTTTEEEKRVQARKTVDILQDIADLLNTGLDRHSLSYCVSLIENGVHPEALAKLIRELQAERAQLEADAASSDE